MVSNVRRQPRLFGVKVVAGPVVLDLLRERGSVFLRPRALRCCGGFQYVLDASLEPFGGELDLVHAADGFQVFTTTGLALPEELHFELDGAGQVQAYWNGQGWIG